MATYLQTYSGVKFDLVNPLPRMVNIGDIAHALSNMPRFVGHTRSFYSVAQHSVHVSRLLPPELHLAGLLHDAAEAYLLDMPTPAKLLLPDYQAMYAGIERAICDAFGVSFTHPLIKQADMRILATEKRDLMSAASWWSVDAEPISGNIVPLGPVEAKALFFKELTTCRPRLASA